MLYVVKCYNFSVCRIECIITKYPVAIIPLFYILLCFHFRVYIRKHDLFVSGNKEDIFISLRDQDVDKFMAITKYTDISS